MKIPFTRKPSTLRDRIAAYTHTGTRSSRPQTRGHEDR